MARERAGEKGKGKGTLVEYGMKRSDVW